MNQAFESVVVNFGLFGLFCLGLAGVLQPIAVIAIYFVVSRRLKAIQEMLQGTGAPIQAASSPPQPAAVTPMPAQRPVRMRPPGG